MPFDPTPLLDPDTCAVVVFECQEGVIGDASALPGLARAVRETDVVGHVATLAEGARRAGVPVVYATLRQRPGEASPPGTTPLEHRLQREAGGGDAEALDMGPVVSALAPAPGDVVVERHRGLTGFHGSGLDAALRETGARTVVLVGVSLNIGIPGTAIEAVNHGYTVVVPPDCVAADPAEHAEAALRHSIRPVAFMVDSADILAVWSP